MPGMEQWEKSDMVQPLPPLMKKMPGRPSLKKRRKEKGEDEESRFVKRPKRQNKCSNCGVPGHYKNKCKNPPAPPKEVDKGGRPYATDEWAMAQRKKKMDRNLRKAYDPQPTQESQAVVTDAEVQCSQAGSSITQAKGKAKATTSEGKPNAPPKGKMAIKSNNKNKHWMP